VPCYRLAGTVTLTVKARANVIARYRDIRASFAKVSFHTSALLLSSRTAIAEQKYLQVWSQMAGDEGGRN
jgi:hypothetical protein